MTDRTRCLTVILDKEYRVDDVQAITHAISMMKGVLSVDINIQDWNTHSAIMTAKRDLEKKMWEILQ